MTPFRTARETLGWSVKQTAEVLGFASLGRVYDLDRGTKEPHPHTLALMQTWAADWFPAEHRPRPTSADQAA